MDHKELSKLRELIAVLATLMRDIEREAMDGSGPGLSSHPHYSLYQQMHDRLVTQLPE